MNRDLMAPLNILMLSSDFSQPPFGGIAAHLHGLCPALERRGHGITLVVPGYGRGEDRLAFQGARLICMRRGGRPRVLRYFIRMLALRRRIAAVALEMKADLIHLHDPLVSPPLVRPLQRDYPIVFTNHTSYFAAQAAKWWGRVLLGSLVGSPDGIITVNPVLAERSRFLDAGELELIPNGVDTALFAPRPPDGELQRNLALASDDRVALFVGRFSPVKGLRYLLRAAAELRDKLPRFRLLLAGGGSVAEEEEVKASIGRLGLERETRLLGPIAHDQLPALYSLAHVLVLPSLMEATSIAGLEAMACGLPLVASDVGGLPLIVAEGITGRLVPPADSGALARALRQVLGDEGKRRRLGAAARLAVEESFTWDSVAVRTEVFYRRVLARRGGGLR